jgi:polysaccharide chain length determinant protein (PEP-CTERM system associated)
MLIGREQNLDDYKALIKRRKWVILLPALIGPLVALIIALALTPKYTSTSLILIEEPKVPERFVPQVVGDDLTARLATMEEQILSRTRLQPIIERYGLYKSDLKSKSIEDVVEQMRKDIVITPVEFSKQPQDTNPNKRTVPGFSIAFTAENPKLAQQVCAELTSMFVEENIRQRENQAEGTTNFLQSNLEEAKRKLDEQNARLAAFQRQYFGSLPEQEVSNAEILRTLTSQLQAVRESIERAQEDKTYVESMLDEELQAWKATQGGSNPESLQQQLAKLKDYLVVLEGRYTDNYPDVIKTKQDIAALKKKIAQQQADQSKQPQTQKSHLAANVEPLEIQKLRGQLQSLNSAIHTGTQEEAHLTAQIHVYQARLQMSPEVEQQYKDITTGYKSAKDFYDSLLIKTQESSMSTSLEKRQEGEQFQVLDAASLPENPSFPNYWLFAGGGLGAGLTLGLGIALLIEMGDKALRDERDIEFFLALPTLALVPEINPRNGMGSSRRGLLPGRGEGKDLAGVRQA